MQISTAISIDGFPATINVPPGTKAWYKANAIFSPVGPAHGTAWFVVTKSVLDGIIAYGSTHTITWTQVQREPKADDKVLSFPNWYILSTERLLQGGNDAAALHLITLVDARYVAESNSESGIVHTNILSYANSADYLTGASGGTWTSFVTALWNACNVLGVFPGLPFAPDGVPTNHRQIGSNPYRTLCKVLNQLDCAIAPNPLLGTFSIVQLGAAQVLPANPGVLQWDGQPTSGTIPGPATVRVYFPIHRKSYGQESDTELANNWSIEKPASVQGATTYIDTATALAGGVGRIALWDDLPDVLDEDNDETLAGAAAVAARAAARTSRYLTRRAVTPAHKIYAGLVSTILPGAKVRAVLWRNWDDEGNDLGGGTVTEYRQQSELITGLSTEPTGGVNWLTASAISPEVERYSPPDLGRSTYPTYPRLPNVVQVYHSVGTQGQSVDPDGTAPGSGAKLHSGRVKRWVANDMATYDDCWILFVDDYDNNLGDLTAVDGEYYYGRLSGMTTSGSAKPVYLVKKSDAAPIYIPFRNDSGYTIPPGGILAPYSSATIGGDEFILADRPSSKFYRRWLVNSPVSVLPGDTGQGSWLDDLSGFAAIDPGSASLIGIAEGWGPMPDSFLLFPAWFGFTLPGSTTYTFDGQLVAYARQHEVNCLIGTRLVSTLNYNSFAPTKIWRRTATRQRIETNFGPLIVYDGLKLRTGDLLEALTRVDIVWNGDAWELANAGCSPEDASQSQDSYQSQYANSLSGYNQIPPVSSPFFPAM